MGDTVKRRPAIKGGFQVLVVPKGDLEQNGLTVPMSFRPTGELVRAVGYATAGDRNCAPWAFDAKSRKVVVKSLRELADWIDANPCS